MVVEARTRQSNGRPTYLNFEARYPGQPFTAVIWQRNLVKFPASPDELYKGRRICVTGEVTEYRGAPQMELRTPSVVQVRGR